MLASCFQFNHLKLGKSLILKKLYDMQVYTMIIAWKQSKSFDNNG